MSTLADAEPFAPLPADARREADDPHGPQIVMPQPSVCALARGVWCPLPDYGLLSIGGADRVAFLQSQSTNDVEVMVDASARWNGYCSAKGRLLSVFLCWREPEAILLTVSRAQAEFLRKRLAMFVLRSKVVVADRSAERLAVGLLATDPSPTLAALGLDLPGAPMSVAHAAGGLTAIRLAPVRAGDGAALERVMLWATAATAATQSLASVAARASGLPPSLAVALQMLSPAPTAAWRWAEIRSATPRVFPATVEHFVPQMVNLELVGGVSFTKGCYPGQEVVARSQYLGKMKRRTFVGQGDVALAPGADVMTAAVPQGSPVGEVVMSAPSPTGGFDCLFECQTDAAQGPLLAGGAPLALLPLPYEIPAAAPVRRKL